VTDQPTASIEQVPGLRGQHHPHALTADLQ